jgi:hypothetical protein
MPSAKWSLDGRSRFGVCRMIRLLQYCCCAEAASAQFSKAWIGLDPQNPAQFHGVARSWLFALQIAL